MGGTCWGRIVFLCGIFQLAGIKLWTYMARVSNLDHRVRVRSYLSSSPKKYQAKGNSAGTIIRGLSVVLH